MHALCSCGLSVRLFNTASQSMYVSEHDFSTALLLTSRKTSLVSVDLPI